MSHRRAYGIGLAAAAALGACMSLSTAFGADLATRAVITTQRELAIAGWPSDGPNCAPVAAGVGRFDVWLGHFTGGRFDGVPGYGAALNWQDRYVCFPSRQACRVWQREMRAAYRQVEGYRTCLPIR